MLTARIELAGDDLSCTVDGGARSRRAMDDATIARLAGWARDYDAAVKADEPGRLAVIGRDMAGWLDEGDQWLSGALAGTGDIALDIVVVPTPCRRGRALLDLPWELLAPRGLFLAADSRLFRVARRLGAATTAAAPRHRDLALMFMAAEVEGEGVLAYEQEEAGILEATQNLDLHLIVEESGGIEGLRESLARSEGVEALHLTCHGTIHQGTPMLALESPEGRLDLVTIDRLCEALGSEERRPPLVMVSACRTAEQPAAAPSLVHELIRNGVANAVGWDGSVFDGDANRFAQVFYRRLAEQANVADAAAGARRDLLKQHLADPDTGRHWHLARVYLGPSGGGALCAAGTARRKFDKDHGVKEFLDRKGKRVPVATAQRFVGRRRQLQQALREFQQGKAVLLHGMGNLGKSSLAARIANRLHQYDVVVVVDRYDVQAVLDALTDALPPGRRAGFAGDWRAAVEGDPAVLHDALEELLEDPFSGNDGNRPILLVIDDLEQRLAQPQPGETATPFKTPGDVSLFAAILSAFRDARTDSRLLLTSRYTFPLTDRRGDDLAARLVRITLPPMDAVQRAKQMRAAGLAADRAPDSLETRILSAAAGNPGLQEILSRPLLTGDRTAADAAVTAVESYLTSGAVPEDGNAAMEFFRRVSLTAFRDMLTPDETTQLRAATLFDRPVPPPVLAVAGAALGVADPDAAVARLDGLGLLDVTRDADETIAAAVNRLARPLVTPLDEAEQTACARSAVAPLYRAWREADGTLPWSPASLTLAGLALQAGGPPDILNAAAVAGGFFLFKRTHDARAALALVAATLAGLGTTAPDPHLMNIGAQCANRLGEAAAEETFLERGLAAAEADSKVFAELLFESAGRLIRVGDVAEGERRLRDAADRFARLGAEFERAVTLGQIADILTRRGDSDEALRIRREEQLPVFERLGDLRERAITLGGIADILTQRGDNGEALRIRREEELPVYERLGDVRSRAATLGEIADILTQRGDSDDALRIHREEVLPACERLGDVQARAVTLGKIADILHQRGDSDEALRLHLEECLPIAQALQLPETLAKIRSSCAMIRLQRGGPETDEAPVILAELDESFTLSRQIQRADFVAAVGWVFGQVLATAGRDDEALAVLDQAAEAYTRLQRPDMVAQVRAFQETIRARGG